MQAPFKAVVNSDEPIWPKQLIFSRKIGAEGTKALCATLEAVPYERLKSLCFWNADIGNEGAAAVAGVLRYLQAVNKVEMLDCLVGKDGCEALGKELGRSGAKHVSILRLDHNPIGAEGVQKLCEGIGKLSMMRTLSLSNCQLGPECGKSLAQLVDVASSELR